jgi:hypothetical protein
MKLALPVPRLRLPPLRFVLGGIALYLLFLFALAPAYLLNWVIKRAAPAAPISAVDLQGSLWSGEARQVSVSLPNGAALAFERVQWRLSPLALLKAQAAARVQLIGSGLQGAGVVGRSLFSGALALSDFKGNAPASFLTQFAPALSIWKPSGTIELETDSFSLKDAKGEGKALVRWKDAAVTLSPVVPLGTYQVTVDGTAAGMQYEVKTLSGKLQVEGKGNWAPDQPPKFLGTARASPGSEAQLGDLLRLMGREESGGVFRLSAQPSP